MSHTITVQLDHPDFESGLIRGFRFFWAFWVSGFNPARHCQPCFKGRRVLEFCTPTAQSGRLYQLEKPDSCRYLYICGVGPGPKSALGGQNFHLALEYQQESLLTCSTYNGYTAHIGNAVERPIPELPTGWQGRDLETTRCKNFRFAVEHFGYPAAF